MKTIQKTIPALVFVCALACGSSAFAQFNIFEQMTNPGGAKQGSSAAANNSNSNSNETTLMGLYVSASKDILLAHGQIADALGLKKEAATARATANALKEGATQGTLEEADKVVAASTAAVSEVLAREPKLSAGAQKKFSEGVGTYFRGTAKYAIFLNNVSSLTSNPFAAIMQAGSMVYLVKTAPSNGASWLSFGKQLVTYGKDHNIAMPANATKAMADLL